MWISGLIPGNIYDTSSPRKHNHCIVAMVCRPNIILRNPRQIQNVSIVSVARLESHISQFKTSRYHFTTRGQPCACLVAMRNLVGLSILAFSNSASPCISRNTHAPNLFSLYLFLKARSALDLSFKMTDPSPIRSIPNDYSHYAPLSRQIRLLCIPTSSRSIGEQYTTP